MACCNCVLCRILNRLSGPLTLSVFGSSLNFLLEVECPDEAVRGGSVFPNECGYLRGLVPLGWDIMV